MAELTYDIDVNVRKALKGLDDLQSKVKKTNKAVEKSNKVFSKFKGILTTTAVVGFGMMIKRSLDAADALGKVANKTGFAVDALQEIRHAAELAGMSTLQLDTSLQRFSRRVGEAGNGTGVLAKDLTALGIQFKNQDGSMRNINSVFMDYMGAIDGATSQQEKLRLAVAAFDMEGAQMVNMLQDGVEGFEEWRAEAGELGTVLDQNVIDKATESKDAWTKVKKQFSAIAQIASAELAPAITHISKSLTEMLKDKDAVQALADSFKTLGDGIKAVYDFMSSINWGRLFQLGAIYGLTKALQALSVVFKALSGHAVWKALGGGVSFLGDKFAQLGATVGKLAKAAGWATVIYYALNMKDAFKDAAWVAKQFGAELDNIDTKIDAFEKSKHSWWDALKSGFSGLTGIGTPQKFDINAVTGESIDDYFKRIKQIGDEQKKLKKEAEDANFWTQFDDDGEASEAVHKLFKDMEELEGVIDPSIALWREYNKQVANVKEALNKGVINKAKATEFVQYLQDEFEASLNALEGFGDEVDEQVEQSKTWAESWKDAFKEYQEAAFDAAENAKTIFNSVTQNMEDAIFNFAKTGKMNFKSFAQSVIDDMLRIQSKKLAANIMGGMQKGGSALGNLFSGYFATGGVIPTGRYGVVGESGPEIVQGPAKVDRMGGNVTYNINAVDAPSFQALLAQDPAFLFALTEQGRETLPSFT